MCSNSQDLTRWDNASLLNTQTCSRLQTYSSFCKCVPSICSVSVSLEASLFCFSMLQYVPDLRKNWQRYGTRKLTQLILHQYVPTSGHSHQIHKIFTKTKMTKLTKPVLRAGDLQAWNTFVIHCRRSPSCHLSLVTLMWWHPGHTATLPTLWQNCYKRVMTNDDRHYSCFPPTSYIKNRQNTTVTSPNDFTPSLCLFHEPLRSVVQHSPSTQPSKILHPRSQPRAGQQKSAWRGMRTYPGQTGSITWLYIKHTLTIFNRH